MSNSILTIRPKTSTYQALQFNGFESVPEIIKFLGGSPVIESPTQLKYKKFRFKVGQYIIKNGENVVLVVDNLDNYIQLSENIGEMTCEPIKPIK